MRHAGLGRRGGSRLLRRDAATRMLEAATPLPTISAVLGHADPDSTRVYMATHRRKIRTNNMIERLNREIRRRTRVVGGFPYGDSALMLACARIRYVTANE